MDLHIKMQTMYASFDNSLTTLSNWNAVGLALSAVLRIITQYGQTLLASILVACLLTIPSLRVAALAGLLVQACVKFGASPNACQHKHLGWIPFLGNGPTVFSKLEGGDPQALFDLIQENDFKSFDIQFPFIAPVVIVMDERDRTFMLKDNYTNFVKNVEGVGLAECLFELFGTSFFVNDGERWRHGRKSALHMFNAKSLRVRTEVVVVEMTEKLVEVIQAKAKTIEVFDLQALFGAFTFDVISKICFGADTKTLEAAASGTNAPFLVAFERVQQLVIRRIIQPRMLWKAQRLFGSSEEVELTEHIRVMNDYLDVVVEEQLELSRVQLLSQESEVDGGKKEKSEGGVLAMYIDYARSNKQPHMLEPEFLRDTIVTLMSAGRDTVAVTLTNAFNQLDLNRECQELLEQESRELFPNNEHATLEQLKKAKYADAVFNETMRFSPPATLNFRYCKSDVVMPSGTHIAKHSMCMIAINAIGRDPAVWGQNANVFEPERWFALNDGKHLNNIPENKLPAFWAGPRACVGKEVARVEAKTVILALMREFEIKVERPLNDDIVENSLAAFRKNGLPVTATLRNAKKNSFTCSSRVTSPGINCTSSCGDVVCA